MIQVFKPYYDHQEIDAVAEVIKSGYGLERWIKAEQQTCLPSRRDTEFRRLNKMVLRVN